MLDIPYPGLRFAYAGLPLFKPYRAFIVAEAFGFGFLFLLISVSSASSVVLLYRYRSTLLRPLHDCRGSDKPLLFQLY